MKILWLCNIIIPKISKQLGYNENFTGGWLTGLSNSIINDNDIKFAICFPHINKEAVSGTADGIDYFGYSVKSRRLNKYNKYLEEYFCGVIESFKPDIIHIWGTEYPHTLAMMRASEKLNFVDKAVISIQGLCSVISKHYFCGLPKRVIRHKTFRDLLKNDNIKAQKKKFEKRGENEIQALKIALNVIGRTEWDKACTFLINPNRKYYFCNETLRDSFYNNTWDINRCERNTIFISQAGYPVKGFHFVIEALYDVKKFYPDVRVYVAEHNITKKKTLKDKFRISSYGQYISNLIKKYNLKDNIIFTGTLNEEAMCNMYLNAHIFVSPSCIENESNSLSEAKILGVPSVVSFVGGVPDRVIHNEDGFLYQHDAPYMLAYYIMKIFANDELALHLSENAKIRATKTHSKEDNLNTLKEIYNDIFTKANNRG